MYDHLNIPKHTCILQICNGLRKHLYTCLHTQCNLCVKATHYVVNDAYFRYPIAKFRLGNYMHTSKYDK